MFISTHDYPVEYIAHSLEIGYKSTLHVLSETLTEANRISQFYTN